MAEKIGMISLGCAKNLADTEQMLYLLDEAGFELTDDIGEAVGVIVNTCGFIDDAKQESIDTILELCKMKSDDDLPLRAVVVAGCLSERYQKELTESIPEADAVLGCSAVEGIIDAVRGALDGTNPRIFGDKNAPMKEIGRISATPNYFGYVRISEGCDNCCSYCVIPGIRGVLRSRAHEDILNQCREMASDGAKELIIIAQDITKYGTDLYGKPTLVSLLRDICAISGLEWIRLHYMNPDGVDDELISFIANEPKILKYLDIPIQHISDKILKDMNRHYDGAYVRALFSKLRAQIPGLVLRTSLISGFPGEEERDFDELCEFLREYKIERAGVFEYSPQEETPAYSFANMPDEDEKRQRAFVLREIALENMVSYSESLLGKTITVLCEDYDRLEKLWFGRSFADSPDIDGKVFFTTKRNIKPGEFVKVEITDTIMGDALGNECVD